MTDAIELKPNKDHIITIGNLKLYPKLYILAPFLFLYILAPPPV